MKRIDNKGGQTFINEKSQKIVIIMTGSFQSYFYIIRIRFDRNNLIEQRNKNVDELEGDPIEASIIRIKGKLIVVELEGGSTHVGVVDYDAVNKDAIIEEMNNAETNMYGRLENYIRVLVKMEPNKEPGRPDMARIIALR